MSMFNIIIGLQCIFKQNNNKNKNTIINSLSILINIINKNLY